MTAPEPRPRRPEVSEGMAAARKRGVQLGRPPAPVPLSAQRAADCSSVLRVASMFSGTLSGAIVQASSQRT